MTIEIVAVGTEILLGDIVNTNAQFLSKELALLGINVYRHTVAGDNLNRLQSAFNEAFERCDMVIAMGGLGPTADDITKEAAAACFGLEMALHEPTLAQLKLFFERVGSKMTDNNVRQAIFPVGARILDNPRGTAPGCLLEFNGKTLILLPGPPNEMKLMFERHVKPYLSAFCSDVLVSRVLRMVGIGESSMESLIGDIIENQGLVTIAPNASRRAAEVELRLSAKAEDAAAAQSLINPVAQRLYDRLGDYIYGEGDTTLAEIVINMLKSRGLKVAVAESITGGGLASAIIGVAGASAVIDLALVAYSNEAKTRLLGVRAESLEKYGAVSDIVAKEMAQGAARAARADIGIATTGIAGPDGGSAEKPVGLTYIGFYHNSVAQSHKIQLFGDRQGIRDRATAHALDFLRRKLVGI